jgi:hypothetical protein
MLVILRQTVSVALSPDDIDLFDVDGKGRLFMDGAEGVDSAKPIQSISLKTSEN